MDRDLSKADVIDQLRKFDIPPPRYDYLGKPTTDNPVFILVDREWLAEVQRRLGGPLSSQSNYREETK